MVFVELIVVYAAHDLALAQEGGAQGLRDANLLESAVTRHWVEPVLIAQVKFTEWTHDDQLRQPVFLGLRSDKQAKDVVRK
jgi:ATP-dependent DNA ligase